jgi:TPR repeat protein
VRGARRPTKALAAGGLAGCLLAAAFPAAAGFEDGVAAAEAGNYQQALAEWRPLAENGHARAQYSIGFLYAKGSGVEADAVKAAEWYRKAAEQGYAPAQFYLGRLYAGEDAAESLVKKEGRDGGEAGILGKPRQVRLERAMHWYQRAAAQGLARAQNNIGLLFHTGKGVPQDATEAAKWYRKAAEQGLAQAQNNLGLLYAEGKGVEKDRVTAYMWFLLAARQGYERAEQGIQWIGPDMPATDIEKARRKAQRRGGE